jgi:ATP/maltotriose-dependent transcriptional regulator MalT
LLLIAAPAGVGKTTLLVQWLADWRAADDGRWRGWLVTG